MKLLFRSIVSFLAVLLLSFTSVNAQNVMVSTETFPNVFNNSATGNVNSTFVGSTGTWSASSNRSYASVAVISYYQNATPNCLFIKNFKGASASLSIATSASIDLSNFSCSTTGGTLVFNVDPSKLDGSNTATVYTIDFSNNGGTTWTTIASETAASIKNSFPTYGWNFGSIAIPASYMVSNFKYRITGSSPANCSYDNEIYFDDISVYGTACTTTTACNTGYTNPLAAAQGFNIFAKSGVTFQSGNTDGTVAMGGNATLNGTFITGMANSGSYPSGFNNANNFGLVIGGGINFTSGGTTQVNSGYLRIGNTSSTNLYYTDCNNAVSNLRVTKNTGSACATDYNGSPRIELNRQQASPTPTNDHGIDFTSAFTTMAAEATKMSGYNGSSACASALNILTVGSGNYSITLAANKINVLNITSAQLNAITTFTFNNLPSATQPLVINVNQTSSFSWASQNTAGLNTAAARFMIFNFYNNTGTVTLTGSQTISGTVFIPSGNFVKNTSGNIEGQVVANNITLNGGEVHYQPFEACLPNCSTYSLGDYVWFDRNNNGIQDSGEPSIYNATVKLYADVNGDDVPDGAALATTTTNGSGAYSFTGLLSGNYIVGVTLPNGYVAGATTVTSADPSNATTNDNNGVTLVSNELRTNSIVLTAANPRVDIGLTTDCSCVNSGSNALTNPSFESGSTGWTVTGGNITTGTGYVMCGANNGFLNQSSGTAIMYQDVATVAGATVTFNAFAGTHTPGISCSPKLSLIFLNASNTVLSQTNVTVTKDVDVTGAALDLYTLSGVAPAGTTKVRVQASIGCNTMKIDALCLTIVTLNLGNTVWYDIDNDGVQEAGEPGIAGVVVKLYDCSGTYLNKTATTDASGNYLLTGLAAGSSYIVGITTPAGYTKSDVGTTSITTDSQNDGTTIVTTEIRTGCFTISSSSNNIDFGLKGLGSIGDYVWFDIDNDGIQEAGETGIANATVTLTYPNGTTKVTTTDVNGAYSFTNLAPGTYSVAFTTPSGYYATLSNQGADDAKDSDPVSGVVSVTLTASQSNTSIDAGFYKKVNLGNTVWFDANNNGLKDTNEPGVSGVTVKLYADANADNIPDGAALATTTTDASGLYSFTNLDAGKYIVGVTLPTGYVATVTTANSTNPNSDTDNDNNGVTTVSGELRSNYITLSYGGEPAIGVDGDATTGNLTLDFGVKGSLNLGNLVWNDTNGNGIKNTFESGITGVTVYLYQDANADNVPDGAAINSTTTTTGGIYAFSNLVPGNYIVGIATPTGFANSFKPTNNANPNSNTDNDNNGVTEVSGIIRSNYITLSIAGEPDVAVDGDGTNGNLTLDFAVAKDTDGDKIPDVIDIDDDNDGITDMNESGGYDPLADCDGDGIPNYLDSTPGCSTPSGNDPWGKPYVALTWTDCNSDGINDFFDWDRDGIINELDLDSDNDGILDVQEARPGGVAVTATANGMITGTDADANGLLSSYENNNVNPVLNGISAQDLDRDGLPNFLDLDSDGDGMTDLTEALGVYSSTGVVTGTDTDGDGVRAESFGSSAANIADNINGFGAKGISLLNSDATIAGVSTGDTYPDAYDIDSDNDGITDNTEAQATCSYKVPTGVDCDGDGVDDAYDATSQCVTCTRTSAGLTPYDKDLDGTPDYLDLDTDSDGAWDIYEGHTISNAAGHQVPPVNYWTGSVTDTDKDGLLDYFDNFNMLTETSAFYSNATSNNMGANGSFSPGVAKPGSIVQLPESDEKGGCAGGGERDWRTTTILPVKLLEFKGNLNNSSVSLSWTVANELNMNMYEIERSTDAVNFTKVASVKATAATTSNKTYASMDNVSNLAANNAYYRLKQLDLNGSYVYSNVISFRLNGKSGSLSIHPNPAVSYFNIKLNVVKEGMASIKIIDMIGRVVNTQNTKVYQGVNSISYNNLNTFSAGTYNVQVMIDGVVYNEKLVITK